MAAAGRGGNLQEEASAAPGAALYAVLGLNRECTDAELKGAYRRLAMVSGMGDFLGEMADMMSQATPTESFEELQQLFVDMFQDDLDPAFFSGLPPGRKGQSQSPPSTSQPSSSSPPLRPPPPGRTNAQAPSTRSGVDERGCSPVAMHSATKRPRPGRAGLELDLDLDLGLSGFCFMVSETTKQRPAPWACEVNGGGDRRSGRKQRLSTSRDVSGDGVPRSFLQSQNAGSTAWWQ